MPTWRVIVDVMPKPEVADPQGQAVEGVLARLLDGKPPLPRGVRIGRTIRFELDADHEADARAVVERLADRVLANHNTETFAIRLEAAP